MSGELKSFVLLREIWISGGLEPENIGFNKNVFSGALEPENKCFTQQNWFSCVMAPQSIGCPQSQLDMWGIVDIRKLYMFFS